MTKGELNNLYFEWMYQLVCDERYSKRPSYRKLLTYLHAVDFNYIIDNCQDNNDFKLCVFQLVDVSSGVA